MELFIINIVVTILLVWSISSIIRENKSLKKELIEKNMELLNLQMAVTRVFPKIKFIVSSPPSEEVLKAMQEAWAMQGEEVTLGK